MTGRGRHRRRGVVSELSRSACNSTERETCPRCSPIRYAARRARHKRPS